MASQAATRECADEGINRISALRDPTVSDLVDQISQKR
jgi:hypothetical protein